LIHPCVRVLGVLRYNRGKKRRKGREFSTVVADKKLPHFLYLAGKAEYGYHVSGKYLGVAVRYENCAIAKD
jgi:hypothetical protein